LGHGNQGRKGEKKRGGRKIHTRRKKEIFHPNIQTQKERKKGLIIGRRRKKAPYSIKRGKGIFMQKLRKGNKRHVSSVLQRREKVL